MNNQATLKNANLISCTNRPTEVKELAPHLAASASMAMPGTSDKYRFISTKALGESIEAMGYTLHSVQHSRVLKQEKQGYQKHLLRFRLPQHMGENREVMARSPEGFPEIVVINSHDGASSMRILAGYFRLVCANGLISGSVTDEFRIKHVLSAKIDERKQLEDGLAIVAGKAKQLSFVAEQWKQIQLSSAAISELVNTAVKARLKDTDYQDREVRVNTLELSRIRRTEDAPTNLWTTFNAIQENAVRSPLHFVDVLDEGKTKVLRAPRAINKLVSINRTLWNAAEVMAG